MAIQKINEKRKLKEQRDKEYLSEKYAILEQFSSSEDEHDRESFDSLVKVNQFKNWAYIVKCYHQYEY